MLKYQTSSGTSRENPYRAICVVGVFERGGAVEPLAAVLRQRIGDLSADGPPSPFSLWGEDAAARRTYDDDQTRRGFVVAMADALVQTRQPAAARVLEPLLDHENTDVRYLAAICLADCKHPRGREILLRNVNGEESGSLPHPWGMDCTQAVALALYGDTDCMSKLLEMLGDGYKHYEAERVLSHMGERAVAWLLAAQEYPNYRVRRKAAAVLGTLQDAVEFSAVDALGSGVISYTTGPGRHTQRDPRVAEALLGALNHPDSYVRGNAALGLGDRRERQTVGLLIAALDDAHSPVRRQAAVALGKIGDRRAVEPLCRALADEADLVRHAAATALGPFRDRRAVSALCSALEDRTAGVRFEAAWALVAIADPSAAAALERAAAREPEPNRRRLIQAAADILGRGDIFLALVEALDSANYDVYQRAAATLGAFGDRRAVAPLIRAYGLRHRIEWDEWFPCPTSEALDRLTGADVAPHPTAWYRWWAVNKSHYPPPPPHR